MKTKSARHVEHAQRAHQHIPARRDGEQHAERDRGRHAHDQAGGDQQAGVGHRAAAPQRDHRLARRHPARRRRQGHDEREQRHDEPSAQSEPWQAEPRQRHQGDPGGEKHEEAGEVAGERRRDEEGQQADELGPRVERLQQAGPRAEGVAGHGVLDEAPQTHDEAAEDGDAAAACGGRRRLRLQKPGRQRCAGRPGVRMRAVQVSVHERSP